MTNPCLLPEGWKTSETEMGAVGETERCGLELKAHSRLELEDEVDPTKHKTLPDEWKAETRLKQIKFTKTSFFKRVAIRVMAPEHSPDRLNPKQNTLVKPERRRVGKKLKENIHPSSGRVSTPFCLTTIEKLWNRMIPEKRKESPVLTNTFNISEEKMKKKKIGEKLFWRIFHFDFFLFC